MALVNFTNLDFDQIKISIKDYLRSNSNFSDYDFEGSNLSTLIDVLAYNTYITSYNANMVSNEVFIDSATLRENVVSLARNIGYVPRSKTSSSANISFFVDTTEFVSNPITLTLKKGTVCTSSSIFGNQSYTFTIKNDITRPVVNNIALFDKIDIYEGTFLVNTFTVDANNPNQRFILDNPNIDTNSISVLIRDTESSSVVRNFSLASSLFDINGSSKVFFIQEIEDQRYELIFGDGTFGVKLENQNFIEVSYVTTNGPDANGSSSFTFSGRILDNDDSVVNTGISLITTNETARSGQDIESIDSIKKYAPRIYSSQNRAVTATDYESIIPTIYTEAESISVFGGEDLTPPKYGRVFISIKPRNGPFVSNQVKDNIKKSLRKYSVAGIVPEIIDLKYLYVEHDSTVYYNENLAPSSNYIRSLVSNSINLYSDSSELNQYGARFKYSKFLKIIDESHNSITSNITKIVMRRDLRVSTNQFANYEICYGNSFHIGKTSGYNIKSSGFKISGISQTLYLTDIPNSDRKTGIISFFRLDSATQPVIVRNNVGSVNYEKGEILLNPVNIISTLKSNNGSPIIEISTVPISNDVVGKQDLYLQLDINNSSLNILSDTISSGSDTSGSTFITTTSYTNGSFVRQ